MYAAYVIVTLKSGNCHFYVCIGGCTYVAICIRTYVCMQLVHK